MRSIDIRGVGAGLGPGRGGGEGNCRGGCLIDVGLRARRRACAGAELHVYPGEGTPIQDVIDGAGDGDVIYVHAGTYVENVDVGKRLTLIGDGADVVTVRAEDATDHVFVIAADL